MTGGRSLYFSKPLARQRSTYYHDLDTEILKENLRFSCVFEKRKFKKSIVTWTKEYYSDVFIHFFKDLLWDPPSHCNQAIKIKIMFRTYPSFVLFFPILPNNIIEKNK